MTATNNPLAAVDHNCRVAQAWVQVGCEVVPWSYDPSAPHRRLKRPGIKGWTTGGAFRTVEQCLAWWEEHPHHYPGLVTGPTSGIWVLDMDRKNGQDGVAAVQALVARHGEPISPQALRVQTPSGGWHVYFRWTTGVRNSQSALAPGVDVRGLGGFVAAPGALVRGQRYTAPEELLPWVDAPSWLVELVLETKGTGGEWDHRTNGTLIDTPQALAAAELGQQERALYTYLCEQHLRGVTATDALGTTWEVVRNWPAGDPLDPWTYEDVQEKVRYVWSREEYAGVKVPAKPWMADAAARMYAPPVSHVDAAVPPSAEVRAMEADDSSTVVALPLTAQVERLTGEVNNRNSDQANGEELAHVLAGKAVWVGKETWFVWTGTYWALDDLRQRQIMLQHELVRLLKGRALGAPEGEREVLLKRIGRLESRGGMVNAFYVAEPLLAQQLTSFDRNPWLLNTLSGTVDLRTGELRPARPEDLITRVTPVAYRPGARDEVWERALEAIVPEAQDREFLQRWLGSCATGVTAEKAVAVLYGAANAGKSTISEAIYEALGNVDEGGYAITWQAGMVDSGDRSVNREEVRHQSRGARLVVIAETENKSVLRSSEVKHATGGDTLKAKALYFGSYDYRPQFKMLMHTNYLPRSADRALQERLRILHLKGQFRGVNRDDRVMAHLKGDTGAKEAVLAWLVEGALAWQAAGRVSGYPLGHEQQLEDYAQASDPVYAFVRTCLEEVADVEEWATKVDIERLYSAFCMTEGRKALGPILLWRALAERGYETRKVQRGGARTVLAAGLRVRPGLMVNDFGQLVATESDVVATESDT